MECCGMSLSLSISLVLGCLGLLYIWGKRRLTLLKNAGFPGPEPLPFVGNLLSIMKGINVNNMTDREKYGDVYGIWMGGIPFINVFDKDILKEVLIKDFPNFSDRLVFNLNDYPLDLGIVNRHGAQWKRLRTIISPNFSGSKLRKMCPVLNECAAKLTSSLEKVTRDNKALDLKSYFGAFTMDAIASTSFGIQVRSDADQLESKFITEARRIFDNPFFQNPAIFILLIFPGLSPLIKKLGFTSFSKKSVIFFTKAIQEIIDDRKAQSKEEREKRVDFLELMLAVEDEHVEQPSENKMTTDEIIGQAFLFFIAGYETTATTLNYLAYALATNPNVQDKLIDEVDTIIGDAEPDYDNIHKLEYMDQVITETLRMYPIVPGLNRYVSKTTVIKGWTFPEGSYINVPVPFMHRDPDVYPEPDVLKPERWANKADIDPMYYLPFGAGPRNCVGLRLAQIELKIALVSVLKKMTFQTAPDTPASITEFQMTGILSPKQPIHLRMKMR